MKKLSLVLAALALVACSKAPVVKQGTASTEIDNHGATETITVNVTLEDDKLTKVEIDETYKGSTKKTLGEDYSMRAASPIGKEWFEQAAFLEEYLVKNNKTELALTADGVPTDADVLAGCTIGVESIMKTVAEAAKAAK